MKNQLEAGRKWLPTFFFTDFAEKGLTERVRISIILFVILYDSDTPASWRMGGK